MATAYTKALDALSRRSLSTRDLERWLKEREFAPDEIAEVIDRLTDSGLLDDKRFAHSFARSRLMNRGMSKRRVSMELSRHGISRELANEVIAQVNDEEGIDEESAIDAAATKKWKSLSKLDPQVGKQRLFGFLARKGFDSDDIRRSIARATAGDALRATRESPL
jgi:regulatory protein